MTERSWPMRDPELSRRERPDPAKVEADDLLTEADEFIRTYRYIKSMKSYVSLVSRLTSALRAGTTVGLDS